MNGLRVLAPGPLALIQDQGRPGWARYGVTGSGAMDRAALRLANRLVGNAEDLAGVELLLGGAQLEALEPLLLALTGPTLPVRLIGPDGRTRAVGTHLPFRLEPGEQLLLGVPDHGLRSYLAVRGGIAVDPVFGSRSGDPVAGIGPAPLRAGRVLAVGTTQLPVPGPGVELAAAWDGGVAPGDPVRVRARLGPRDDWFEPAARARLAATSWTVGGASDRVGLRLEGALLGRAPGRDGELRSEPVVRGAIQVSSSGEPVIFLADHPTTGGYPVIAVVDDADQDVLGQLRPGDLVRITPWG